MWITFKALLSGSLRDRISLFWATLFPIGLLIGLGYLFPVQAYRQQLLLGVLAVSAVSFAMMGTGFEIMRQRRKGVYKLLRATPFSISAFIASLTMARGMVSLVAAVGVLAIGLIVFGLNFSVTGLVLMLLVLTVGVLCFSFLGVIVGNLAGAEPQVAMMNNLLMLPMLFGSEAFYSLSRAPEAIKVVNRLLPLSYFLDAVRAAVNADLAAIWLPLLALTVYTGLMLGLAVVTFRWEPDGKVRLSLQKA